ncbi:MAG TPA: ricin-type beta-trefoil lectin domain protein [Trebonia sp.]|nr:ricin-type beta-trefoil lectin domain protein [Trebonia sp.]
MRVRQRGLRLAGTLAVALTGMLTLAAVPAASASLFRPAGIVAAKTSATLAKTPAKTPASLSRTVARPGRADLPAGVRQVCPTPTRPGVMACLSLIHSSVRGSIHPDLINPLAYKPADLQQAYNLVSASANDGNGMTVAIVDGGDDPNAASDLAAYRAEWGLPACQPSGAGCVVKVNQEGKAAPLPIADPTGGWQVEESLDLDMVSAICPNCRILLVEANLDNQGFLGFDPTITDFAAAEDSAVSLGAKFISNSWGGPEYPGIQAYDSAFQHPGVAITVAAGDDGYGASYPATSQFVTSVGGTSLAPAAGTARGWTETVWDGTGSGCSATEAKPAWQTADDTSPDGCLNRTDNDVSAVADPSTGVWIYDSNPIGGESPGWQPIGGTSAASPIIAAVYALAGAPKPGTYPASYLYQDGAAHLFPVTSGSNGVCESYRAYLCNGQPGYNAPAGLGTPDGTAAFTAPAGDTVTVTDPGTQDRTAGTAMRLALQATDSDGQALTYTARNLPSGLSISSSGLISGTPKTASTSTVTVTAADASGTQGSASFRFVVLPSLTAGYHRVTGQVTASTAFFPLCLNDTGNSTKKGTRVEFTKCSASAAQQWALVPDAGPDGIQTLQLHGLCLDITGLTNRSGLRLWPCNGTAGEQWSLGQGDGSLQNPVSGRCLTDPNAGATSAAQAEIYDCADLATTPSSLNLVQTFLLPVGPLMSAVGRMCAEDPGNSGTRGTAVRLEPCDGSLAQRWDDFSDFMDSMNGDTRTHHGLCLSAPVKVDASGDAELVEGIPVVMYDCMPSNQNSPVYVEGDWLPARNGEIFNLDTGLCLADPGSSTAKGTKLALEDCDGDAGEIWAVG